MSEYQKIPQEITKQDQFSEEVKEVYARLPEFKDHFIKLCETNRMVWHLPEAEPDDLQRAANSEAEELKNIFVQVAKKVGTTAFQLLNYLEEMEGIASDENKKRRLSVFRRELISLLVGDLKELPPANYKEV